MSYPFTSYRAPHVCRTKIGMKSESDNVRRFVGGIEMGEVIAVTSCRYVIHKPNRLIYSRQDAACKERGVGFCVTYVAGKWRVGQY